MPRWVASSKIEMVLPGDHNSAQALNFKKARRQHYKSNKNRPTDSDSLSEWTAFRAAEKKYKARFPPPDLSNVLDLAALDEARADEVTKGGWSGRPDAIGCTEIGLKSGQGKAYVFQSHPGLVLLPGYLSQHRQRELTQWALRDHARMPNETNLDTHYLMPEGGLWNAHIESLHSDTVPDVKPKASALTGSEGFLAPPPGPRQLISNSPATAENVHSLTLSASAQPTPAPSLTVNPSTPSNLIRKLRWANVGWYYNWTTKQYDFTKGKVEVAPQIMDICQGAVEAIDWSRIFTSESQWGETDEDWRTWNETYGMSSD